jgi:hypothetical protein
VYRTRSRYIPYEKVTTLTTFLGLIQKSRNFPTSLAMYMAIKEGMFSGFRLNMSHENSRLSPDRPDLRLKLQ